MTATDKEFARDWYNTRLTVARIAAKYGVAEGEVRVRAVNRLCLGPRDNTSCLFRQWTGGAPDRRKEVGL